MLFKVFLRFLCWGLPFTNFFVYPFLKRYKIMSKEKNQDIGIDLEELKDVIQIAVRNEIETCLTALVNDLINFWIFKS